MICAPKAFNFWGVTKPAADFTGGDGYACAVKCDFLTGKYNVYLRKYGEKAEGVPYYCIRFANDGLWNAELKAKKIGESDFKRAVCRPPAKQVGGSALNYACKSAQSVI